MRCDMHTVNAAISFKIPSLAFNGNSKQKLQDLCYQNQILPSSAINFVRTAHNLFHDAKSVPKAAKNR